ncbi:dihydrodipicolinate reductase [Aldersonia kunmingensis]|uniref:NAD(P)H-dependent amine dehydrogenase family protein n=1 Tax=Aldersonia kunmingensis TaxID=408066 RepID=UPI00082B83D8|nr:dihydrodipicolinate reductase [Aldersonia kunmingensis]
MASDVYSSGIGACTVATEQAPLRVIQWTTGNIGRRSLYSIIDRHDMELVGVYAHGEEKVGKDAADLCGYPTPTGVIATNDIAELIALKPDACCYNPLWSSVDELEALLSAGINVCTTAGWITGGKLPQEDRDRIEKACYAGGSTMFGSGAHPGITNMVGMVLSGCCERVDEIRITESVDCSTYRSAGTQTAMGFSQDPETPGLAESVRRESEVFAESAAMMADAMGVTLDRMTFDVEFTAATDDSDLGFMKIPKGTVGSVFGYHRGWVGDRNVVSVGFNWIMGEHVTPPKPLADGHVIQVFGVPNMRTVIHCLPPFDWDTPEEWMELGMIYTALPVTNAVSRVVAAPPGIVTLADLPPITGYVKP